LRVTRLQNPKTGKLSTLRAAKRIGTSMSPQKSVDTGRLEADIYGGTKKHPLVYTFFAF
jgi:hypothetical protein